MGQYQTVALLREFDPAILMQGHSPELMQELEDDRLEKLNEETLNWWKNINVEKEVGWMSIQLEGFVVIV